MKFIEWRFDWVAPKYIPLNMLEFYLILTFWICVWGCWRGWVTSWGVEAGWGGGAVRLPWQPVGRAFSAGTRTTAVDAADNHWFPACQGLKTCTLSRNQNTIGLLAKKCCSPRVSFVGMLKTKLRMPLWIKWGAEWGVRKNKQEDAKLEWGDRIC